MIDKFENMQLANKWKWCITKEIGSLINGDRGKNYPSRKHYINSGIPFISAGNLHDGKIAIDGLNFISEKKFNDLNNGKLVEGDIIYCLRGTLGKIAIFTGLKSGAISSSLVILRLSDAINRKYIFCYLDSPFGKELIRHFDNGTAQPNLSAESVSKYQIPLAPFHEQNAIVDKIEQLFSDLNNAIDNLKKAKDQLKVYRQSVLKYAFEGKLVMFNNAINKPLKQLAQVKGGKRLPKGEKIQENKTYHPYIRVVDFKDYSVDVDSLKYITEEIQRRIARYIILKDDVFISIAGTIGRVGMVPDKLDGANLTENAAKITEIVEVLPRYLMYYLASPNVQKEIFFLKKATSQPKLALYRIEKISVEYPKDINIQKKIVSEIESRFSICNKMEETIENSLNKAEALRQSILKQAFEGKLTEEWRKEHPELITGENSAKALLEKIKADREILKNTGKRKQ